VPMIILQSKDCRMLFRLSICVHCVWLARSAKWGCHRGSVCDGLIFFDGFAVPNAPDLFESRQLSGTGPGKQLPWWGAAQEVLKVLSSLSGAVCFDTCSCWLIAAWTVWHFQKVGKAPFTVHYNQAEGIICA